MGIEGANDKNQGDGGPERQKLSPRLARCKSCGYPTSEASLEVRYFGLYLYSTFVSGEVASSST